MKATNVSWAKSTHMHKQGVEDSQINGCVPDEVTQQTGHIKSSFFNAYCTDMNQNMLHGSSGFNVQKEANIVLRWNINANDEELPLVEQRISSKMDIARMLTPKYDDHCKQCKSNLVQWPCLDNFMFHLLPFLSEIFVQDGTHRTLAYPTHQTSLHLLKTFPRYAKWAQHQRNKIIKQAESLKSDAMVRQDKDTQELFSSILNEVRHLKNNFMPNEILLNTSQLSHCAKQIFSDDSHDLVDIRNAATNLITLSALPPIPEKTPASFVELLKEYFKYEYHKCIGYCKLQGAKNCQ